MQLSNSNWPVLSSWTLCSTVGHSESSNRNINPSNQLVSNVSNLHSFGIESDGQLGRDHIENLPLLPFGRWLGTPFLLSYTEFIKSYLYVFSWRYLLYLRLPHCSTSTSSNSGITTVRFAESPTNHREQLALWRTKRNWTCNNDFETSIIPLSFLNSRGKFCYWFMFLGQ